MFLFLLVVAMPVAAAAQVKGGDCASRLAALDKKCSDTSPVSCVRRVQLQSICGTEQEAADTLREFLPLLYAACNAGSLYACCAAGVAFAANPSGTITTVPARLKMCDAVNSGGGARTVVVTTPPGSPPVRLVNQPATRETVAGVDTSLRSTMKRKGILVEDLTPIMMDLRARGARAASRKDWARAYDMLAQLDAAIDSIVINHEFVQAKFHRINGAYQAQMKALSGAKKKRVLRLLEDVSTSFSDKQYDRANRRINQISALLEGR